MANLPLAIALTALAGGLEAFGSMAEKKRLKEEDRTNRLAYQEDLLNLRQKMDEANAPAEMEQRKAQFLLSKGIDPATGEFIPEYKKLLEDKEADESSKSASQAFNREINQGYAEAYLADPAGYSSAYEAHRRGETAPMQSFLKSFYESKKAKKKEEDGGADARKKRREQLGL